MAAMGRGLPSSGLKYAELARRLHLKSRALRNGLGIVSGSG
uniref:Uncharacterized protein n=1 Tax=Agrobacterium tumefaciens TaxID=358 RepID=A0A3S6I8X4_AGRTU|nr:hypothetical protein [Agrobacterium radiobacter]ARU12305.1 hypothetical protein AgrTiEU6_74 [Agrobacterium tumefaciens]